MKQIRNINKILLLIVLQLVLLISSCSLPLVRSDVSDVVPTVSVVLPTVPDVTPTFSVVIPTEPDVFPTDPDLIPNVPDGKFYVNPQIDLGKINPLVYGVNHGPWAIITDKTLPLAQDARITMIRFPGGEWGDENIIHTHHVDQFVSLADQMGSEVSINVRLLNGTPDDAADLVRYANLEKGYGIKYWGIGNEPSLYAIKRGYPDYGVDQFNQEWREFALAMKDVDNSILVSGPAIHQFGSDIDSTPKDPFGKDWMREFLIANGDLVDVVTFHRYPFPLGNEGRPATIAELSAATAEWDQIIPYLREMVLEITGREIPVAVTEINSHWSSAMGGEATPDSFYNAIWWADVLGRMIVNRVDIVNYFTLQSPTAVGGYGLFARSEPRPTYYIYQIYKEFGHNLVFSSCTDPLIGIYAARDANGGLSIVLVNLGSESVTRPLVIEYRDFSLTNVWKFTEEELLYQPLLQEYQDWDNITIPEQSVLLLKFE